MKVAFQLNVFFFKLKIDECDRGNGGCAENSRCINTDGSYYCGECTHGFFGNQTIGCHNRPGMCPDGSFCDDNSECVRLPGLNYYVCRVNKMNE